MHEQQNLFVEVTCEHCKQRILSCDALIVTKHKGRSTVQYTFCGERCANEYYLEMLRKGGM